MGAVPVDPGPPVGEVAAVTSITEDGAEIVGLDEVIGDGSGEPVPEIGHVVFNLYVDGELVDSETLLETEPGRAGEIAERQNLLARVAVEEGKKFYMDIDVLGLERVRWGTDVDGEVVPVEAGVALLANALDKHFGRPPCDATKMGYVCMRGGGHEPPTLHAQLVRVIDEYSLRVAMWYDDGRGVALRRIDRANPAAMALERAAAVVAAAEAG
jgi:hypothetical protein